MTDLPNPGIDPPSLPSTTAISVEYKAKIFHWAAANSEALLNEYLSERRPVGKGGVRRFLAALKSYDEGLLSYYGFLHRVYGDPDYLIFPEVRIDAGEMILDEVMRAAKKRQLLDDESFIGNYPDLFEFYDPALFGPSPNKETI